MPNKVIIKNKLKAVDKELAEKLEKEASKRMLWSFQKDPKEKEEKEKDSEK